MVEIMQILIFTSTAKNLGFTALATKLEVEELRIHINAYFDRIIGIIEKHHGQVLKFAGDALFVAWQVKTESSTIRKGKNIFISFSPIVLSI